jgi:hypothetical protein
VEPGRCRRRSRDRPVDPLAEDEAAGNRPERQQLKHFIAINGASFFTLKICVVDIDRIKA